MTESIAARRARLLGSRAPQYYDTLFQPVRGRGVWLYTADGSAFLDAYNNVPHVGHCHPDVVEAVCRQTRLLNTNTRYHFEAILDYADRLIQTLPPGLDVCAFTCTGSEANDLAWRLAQRATGATGAITTEHAYHGNTTFLDTIDGSSVKVDRLPASWWATIPAPSSGEYATTHIDDAIARLERNGHGTATLFLDGTFASDGLLFPEPGCLDPTVTAVHARGGLVIADEVQAGLGRLGSHLWAFERLGIVPDVVTMGKPMANGEPLGVVVTRREILERFQAEERYFNTFAGNPVACRAGLAVLEVMDRDQLQANAAVTGELLKRALQDLGARHPYIGGVRGTGFMLGVEICRRGHPDQPGPSETRWIVNELFRRRVIVGMTGPDRQAMHIIKVRPPMVFSPDEADRLISAMDGALAALAASGIASS